MPTPRLIIAASEHCPDQLYATGFFAPDPFLFLEKNGKRSILLNDLEIDRGRSQAHVDTVISESEISKGLPKPTTFIAIALQFLKKQKVRRALVPSSFPLGLATKFAKAGIELIPQTGLFWKEREFKTEAELKQMRRALKITEAGLARAMEVLRASEIGPRHQLRWGGRNLTSEILRAEIDSAILHEGGQPANTIVAGGNQACDPHERGHGPLSAHSLIILDVFPRDATTGYFGDMTRTVVRGKASDAQRRLWETVRKAQELTIKDMKPGADGGKIHDAVKDYFTLSGYPTELRNGRQTGFFHGTGHGLGLEIHEEPRFSKTIFKPGQVITVEPGLYYPGVGGVRIEDVVTLTKTGVKMLSKFPIELELT